MANWSTLKAAIASIIKTNGNKEITGQLLQNVLNNIVSSVGENSTFAGIATPTTNPGVPDGNVFYFATETGTYSNFNAIKIESGEAVILEWRGSWVKKTLGIVTEEKITSLEKQKFGCEYIQELFLYTNDSEVEDVLQLRIHRTGEQSIYIGVLNKVNGKYFGYKTLSDNPNGIIELDLSNFNNINSKSYILLKNFDINQFKIGANNIIGDIPKYKAINAIYSPQIKNYIDSIAYNRFDSIKVWDTLSVFGILKKTGYPISLGNENFKLTPIYQIPNSVNKLLFSNTYNKIGDWAGFAILDANYKVLYVDGGTKELDLSNYPTAKYLIACSEDKSSHISFIKLYDIVEYGRSGENLKNSLTSNELVTLTNSASQFNGILKSITVNVGVKGVYKIGIGILDQNNFALIRETFSINVLKQLRDTTVDISDLNKSLFKGEQVFIYSSSDLPVRWSTGLTNLNGHYLCHGSVDGQLSTNGLLDRSCTLHYELFISGNTPTKADIDEVNSSIKTLEENVQYCINNLNKVTDENGEVYKIKVVDGELKIVLANYRNPIFMGNSITLHASVDIWKVGDRGMAATIAENDYVHKVVEGMKKKYADISYSYISSTTTPEDMEVSNLINTKYAIETYQEEILDFADWSNNYDFSKHDCLIISLGENASTTGNVDKFIQNLKGFISYIRSKSAMDIYLCSSFWAECTNELLSLSKDINIPYINFHQPNNENKQYLGAFYSTQEGLMPITHNGVAYHTNDYGMEKAANSILAGLGYAQSVTSHTIIVNSAIDYYCPNKAVKNQIVTILLYEDGHSVKISDVDVTKHDMTGVQWINTPSKLPVIAYTFIMPDNDITIIVE